MAVLFFDSSGLVKLYIAETGTSWVIDLLRTSATNEVFVAGITGIEVASAFARRLKAGSLDPVAANKALFRFKRDFSKHFIVIDLTPQIIEQGILLAEKHALRGYDTAQPAVALTVKNRLRKSGITSTTFVSADNDLNHAAQAEGLIVQNPNDHP